MLSTTSSGDFFSLHRKTGIFIKTSLTLLIKDRLKNFNHEYFYSSIAGGEFLFI